MNDCVLCGHAQDGHRGEGCQSAGRFSACVCRWVEQPPLSGAARAEEHRARSDWWDGQARAAWEAAQHSRGDLERWYPLMRFHRVARGAEIAHRRLALSLDRTPALDDAPAAEPAVEHVRPAEPVEPGMTFGRRLELAGIA